MTDQEDNKSEFENLADQEGNVSLVVEFIDFLKTNKKWWLAPIIVVMLLMGALIFLSGSAAAPFIYTLF